MKSGIKYALALAELCRPAWGRMSDAIEASGVPTAHVAEKSLRDKARNIEQKIAEAREQRAPAQKALDEAIASYAGSSVGEDSDEFKAAKDARGAVGEIDDRIASMTQQLLDTVQMAGTGDPGEGGRPGQGQNDLDGGDGGWSSESLFTEDKMVEYLEINSRTKAHMGQIRLGEVMGREALLETLAVNPVEPLNIQRRGAFRGILPQLRQDLTILNLIPKGTMDNNTFEYAREEGALKGAAKVVPEGTKKPQGAFEFIPASAKAETIAEFMKLKKQALADVPSLRSTIDGRLRYLLERCLEAEILSGGGPTEGELEGLLPVAGKGVVKIDAENDADKLLSGITTVMLAFARADVIAVNPLDWERVLKQKATGGDEQYYGGGPLAITPERIWGVTLVPALSVPKGRALVADLSIAAQLLIREGISVLLSDADGTDFTDNLVTILAEMRAANVIWRPSAMCEVFLSKEAEEEAEAE